MSEEFAVGVDVGATKILAGVIDCREGTILSTVKAASPENGAQPVIDAIEAAIAQAIDEAPKHAAKKIERIGIGVPGQVDNKKEVLTFAPNLGGGIRDVPLVSILNARFDLPVKLGNDVEVAALGEGHFGAGKGCDLFACVFVGTGIGGALMQNGARFQGAAGSAGEIGHTMVQAGGRKCGCGQLGHLEAYASRTAIVSILREAVEAGAISSMRELLLDTTTRVRSKPLAEAVHHNDALVVNTMTEAGIYLGAGIASMINLWSPRRVIIGGGVIDRIDLLFNVAAQHAKAGALPAAGAAVDIVRADLGDNSGMVGAALLGTREAKQH